MELKGKVGRKSKYSDDRLKFLADVHKEAAEPIKQEISEPEPPLHTEPQPPEITPAIAPAVAEVRSVDSYEKQVLLEELRKGREERYELLHLLSSVTVNSVIGTTESAVHSFFRSMADVVSQFPPHKIAEVRTRVCHVVSEVEIQVLSETSPAEQLEVSLQTPNASVEDVKR